MTINIETNSPAASAVQTITTELTSAAVDPTLANAIANAIAKALIGANLLSAATIFRPHVPTPLGRTTIVGGKIVDIDA